MRRILLFIYKRADQKFSFEIGTNIKKPSVSVIKPGTIKSKAATAIDAPDIIS